MTELSYCTNVHPATDVTGLLDQLDRYAVPIRDRLDRSSLGVGLWLPANVVRELLTTPAKLTRLRHELTARGLRVVTLNAFPYGGFHDDVVKHAVYRPDWTERARLDYTLDCARVLAELLPADAEYGSISTLPLAWREPWSAGHDAQAEAALAKVSAGLRRITAHTGRRIVLAVEPEPGCVLDTMRDAVRWLAGRVDRSYIGLCLDTCHFAVSFEDPVAVLAEIEQAGLTIAKVQVSAALHVPDPADARARRALAEFAEPRYLHQVRELDDGVVRSADDLPADLPGRGPWRVHYHVPLHAVPAAPLRSTTDVTRAIWEALPHNEHLHADVETYTWTVLPERHREDLVTGIASELTWVEENLFAKELTR